MYQKDPCPNPMAEPLPPKPEGYVSIKDSYERLMAIAYGPTWRQLPPDMRNALMDFFNAGSAAIMGAMADTFERNPTPGELVGTLAAYMVHWSRDVQAAAAKLKAAADALEKRLRKPDGK